MWETILLLLRSCDFLITVQNELPVHMEGALLLQILSRPIAVVWNIKKALNLFSFVVTLIGDWSSLLSVQAAVDLSSVCQAWLMFSI